MGVTHEGACLVGLVDGRFDGLEARRAARVAEASNNAFSPHWILAWPCAGLRAPLELGQNAPQRNRSGGRNAVMQIWSTEPAVRLNQSGSFNDQARPPTTSAPTKTITLTTPLAVLQRQSKSSCSAAYAATALLH